MSLQVTTMGIVFLWFVTRCNLVNKCCRFTGVYYYNTIVWRFCSSILKMEAAGSCRALLLIYRMLSFHISEEGVLNLHYSEGSLIIILSFLPSITVVWLIWLRIVNIGLCFLFPWKLGGVTDKCCNTFDICWTVHHWYK